MAVVASEVADSMVAIWPAGSTVASAVFAVVDFTATDFMVAALETASRSAPA
jgi:hypothetical protein